MLSVVALNVGQPTITVILSGVAINGMKTSYRFLCTTGEPSNIQKKKSFWETLDSYVGMGIDGVSTSVDFTSKTVNNSIRKTEELGTGLIKQSAEIFTEITPQFVKQEDKVLPESVERMIHSTASFSTGTTKKVNDSIGSLTGFGGQIGASAFKIIPIQSNTDSTVSKYNTTKALQRLVKISAGAVRDTFESTQGTTGRITNSGIDAIEAMSGHLLGNQIKGVVGTSLRATKDVVDTFNSTKTLNIRKLSAKTMKKARDEVLKELSKDDIVKPEDVVLIIDSTKPKVDVDSLKKE